MSDKSNDDGSPNILFLEDELPSRWPKSRARIITPITDPFVKYHGALGGFVRVHLLGDEVSNVNEMVQFCRSLPQVELAYGGEEGAVLLEMPLDREGDIIVIAKENAVIGSRKDEHDLSQLQGFRLRSHGGLSEQNIPLIRSTPLDHGDRTEPKLWRNFDIFDVALNW
jgi:phosphonoacetate hydrolase